MQKPKTGNQQKQNTPNTSPERRGLDDSKTRVAPKWGTLLLSMSAWQVLGDFLKVTQKCLTYAPQRKWVLSDKKDEKFGCFLTGGGWRVF